MSEAITLIQKIQELGYYGQHDDYGKREYDQDAKEYLAPFKDLQLPDASGDTPRPAQTYKHRRKNKKEDAKGNEVS